MQFLCVETESKEFIKSVLQDRALTRDARILEHGDATFAIGSRVSHAGGLAPAVAYPCAHGMTCVASASDLRLETALLVFLD